MIEKRGVIKGTKREDNTLKGALSRAVEWRIIDSHDLNKVKSLKTDNAVVRHTFLILKKHHCLKL